jgi:hypothetical protein
MCTKPQWNSVPSFKHTISQVSGEEIRSVILIHCHLLPRAPPLAFSNDPTDKTLLNEVFDLEATRWAKVRC